jgi:hypothetical protein
VSVAPYAKAIAAFVTTAATTVAAALLLGTDGGVAITQTEWISIAVTTILAAAGVFLAPANKAPEAPPAP